MGSYASRALTDVESRYSPTESEMLAIVWSAENFHLYMYGASGVVIYTNYKPLLGIVKSQRPASARIERWRLRLMPYQFKLICRPGKDDKTTKLGTLVRQNQVFQSKTVNYVCNSAVPKAMTLDQVRQHISTDTVVQAVTRAVKTGRWNDARVTSNFRNVQNELTTCNVIVLRGTRIVLPAAPQAVELAHVGHRGIVKTKKLLREKVWFPGIDCMTEKQVKSCLACQTSTSGSIIPEPTIATPLPSAPCLGCLLRPSSYWRLPSRCHGRPQANGGVERFVAPLMKAIRATHILQRSWKQELYNFLRQYRATPYSTTGISPVEALNGRKLRVTLTELSQ